MPKWIFQDTNTDQQVNNDKSIFLFPHTPKNHDLFDDLIEVVRLGLLLGFPNLLTEGLKPNNPIDFNAGKHNQPPDMTRWMEEWLPALAHFTFQ